MVQIDWGNLTPTSRQRARVQARIEELAHLEGSVVTRRRGGHRYAVHLTAPRPAPAELVLIGDDLAAVVERAVRLLELASR